MEVASPPKRMTRARAAATKSTNATATTTSTTRGTSTKRKVRSDDTEDEDRFPRDVDTQTTMNKPARTRGRAKKTVDPDLDLELESQSEAQHADDAPAAPRATRGRPRRAIATTATAPTTSSAAKQEPAKTTRTRTRKTTIEDTDDSAPVEPVKKTTRGRAVSNTKTTKGVVTTTVATEPTPGLKSAVSRPASRMGGVVRKTVTFQEPEKENLIPTAATKTMRKTTDTPTGMRAKPVRKPVAGGRTTRASAKAATTEDKREKSPLSPKKDNLNRALSRDASSDDELATYEKTPIKPLMRSPVKPPTSARKFDLPAPIKEGDENTRLSPEPTAASVFGSPARRPVASPWKDAMKSPAKRVDGIPTLLFPSASKENSATQPLFKSSSILQSPAKRPHVPIQSLQPSTRDQSSLIPRSPLKASLLNSPAKRPTSPIKFPNSTIQSNNDKPELFFPDLSSPVKQIPIAQDILSEPSDGVDAIEATDDLPNDENEDEENGDDIESPTLLAFPGRLSAVLPRHADPALKDSLISVQASETADEVKTQIEHFEASDEIATHPKEITEDPMDVDETEMEEADASSPIEDDQQITPPQSPPTRALHPLFGLRAKDLDDNYMSESEDELALSNKKGPRYLDDTTLNLNVVPSTPSPASFDSARGSLPSSAKKAANRAIRSISRGSKLGFTPLAMQLGEWKASSPLKLGQPDESSTPEEISEEGFSLLADKEFPTRQASPSKGFFDDEMKIRVDMENQAAMEAALEADIAARYEEPEFNDINITKEDVELAAEANEMSLLDTKEVEEMIDVRAHDDSISEASQEYGDENAVPIDPALLDAGATGSRNLGLVPVTPVRSFAPRSFHTVSKVPLKPADDSTPQFLKKRSASASKLPVQRPMGPSRNATVISYSPTKICNEMELDGDRNEHEDKRENPPVTPAKSDIWSSIGTPARTPRRDLDPSLLRGAVVFVDVHTSEGADASTVFVELLTQMGARCVKSWPWNPTSPTNGETSAAKVGITHVVYKDGGKRTMEKVRDSNGVVQCVGVGWVLDCERENEWLDEAPYYIDTSLVPRGGRNRRKSMEPKALANMNGTLAFTTPMKNTSGAARDCQTVPNNHMSRRESTMWIRTPSDRDEDEDAPGDRDWESEVGMLTPVPKTPAPEAIRKFAMNVTPETPVSGGSLGGYSPEQEQLLMRTCPPRRSGFADLGDGLLRRDKDQGVLMRLMAARRKSLQFAPKVASPLSKAWN